MTGAEPSPRSDRSARVVVSGVVDSAVVASVASAVQDALRVAPGVEVDVRGVCGWDADAVRALAGCARLGPGVEILMDGKRARPGSVS